MRNTEPASEISRHLLTYWDARRGACALPGRRDIDPAELTPILPNLLLVDVAHDPLDFAYRLIGTEIVENSARDYTGTRLMDLPGQRPPSAIWTLYETCVRERRPVRAKIPYLRIEGHFVEMMSLPLAADGATIDMLIASVTFEDYDFSGTDLPAI